MCLQCTLVFVMVNQWVERRRKIKNLSLVFGVSQTERLCSSLVRQGRYRNRSYRKPIVSFTRSFTGLVICLCKIAKSFCCQQIQNPKLLFYHCGASYWQFNDNLVTTFGPLLDHLAVIDDHLVTSLGSFHGSLMTTGQPLRYLVTTFRLKVEKI